MPDQLLSGHEQLILVDIAVSCPSAPSYARHAATRYGYTAELRRKQKHTRYEEELQRNPALSSAKLVAFALESYGAIDGEAVDLLANICKHHATAACRLPAFQHALASISFALQRGNAMVALEGLWMLRRHVWAGNRQMQERVDL